MPYIPLLSWPTVLYDPEDIRKLYGKPLLGNDLEWDENERPTILGLSDGVTSVSVPFSEGLPYFRELLAQYPDTEWVGHNLMGADVGVLARLGLDLPIEKIWDTIILHWLVNPHLSKSTGKSALEEDENERRGRGFNNLFTMASLYTNLPHWKSCRKQFCEGPCPAPSKGPNRCPNYRPEAKFIYNGIDSLAPVLALPALIRTARLRGVDKLYPMHRELAVVLSEMRDYGIRVDVPYINRLKTEFAEEKEEIGRQLPFNPDSPKQVMEYFKGTHNLRLDNAQEETIREAVEEDDTIDELVLLLDYKELGNGPDRWFRPQYRDEKTGYVKGFMDGDGWVHPRLAFFTSSGRLMCSSPNLQNVSKRRLSRKTCECGVEKGRHPTVTCKTFRGESIGKKVRRAIIAPNGWYITRADYSNAENRVFLHLSGYDPPEGDLHRWMVKNIGLTEDDPFSISLGSARDASKSVTHAADYGEGLQLKTPEELRKPRIRKEIDEGARIVFWDWTFQRKVVTFTGINLARRAFKEATFENRRRANEITARYIDQTFPKIRELQRKIFKQVETESVVRPPHGYTLLSYGPSAEDRLKTALATWGCVAPETLVLTSDLRWIPNGDLMVGQELIGFEEQHHGPRHRRLFPSRVESIGPVFLPSSRIVTDRGEIVASNCHLWLSRNRGRTNLIWKTTNQLRSTDEIAWLCSPWEDDQSYEGGYLAAGVDGEGSIERRIVFYQADNEMLQTMIDFGRAKGFRFFNDAIKRRENPKWKANYRLSINGLPESLRFAGSIRPKRLDCRRLWEGVHPFGRYAEKATVLRIEPLGVRELVGMKTSTRTFLSNGLFSHNSQPVAHFTKLALLNSWKRWKETGTQRPVLQCHDEILVYTKNEIPPFHAVRALQEDMNVETPEIPGFTIPTDGSYGPDWRNQTAVK